MDALIALVLLAVALAVRCVDFGSLGLDHFDAGAYALSASAVAAGDLPGGLFAEQHLLSPPLYFGLAGLVMKLALGVTDAAPLWVAIVLGSATAPLAFFVGRDWHGRAAGVAAGTLVALSDFHALFSRMALTDAPFAFFFLLALWLHGRAETRRSWEVAIVAGLAAGLAWNTKYHGWLAPAIVAFALVLRWLRGERAGVSGQLTRLAIVSGVAIACYLPWVLMAEAMPGGYSAVLRQQRAFLSHAGSFWTHVAQHTRALGLVEHGGLLDGWLARLAPVAAVAGAGLVTGTRGKAVAVALACAAWAGLSCGGGRAACLLAVPALVVLARRGDLPALITAAYVLVFVLLTPLYTFYARLLLPMLVAACLAAGAVVGAWLRGASPVGAPSPVREPRATDGVLARVLLCAALVAMGGGLLAPVAAPVERRSDGLRVAATRIGAELPPDARVCVVGEPALVFYLRGEGRVAFHVNLPGDLAVPPTPRVPGPATHVVLGAYARKIPDWSRWREERAAGLREVLRLPVVMSTGRLLDDLGARAAPRPGKYDLELLQVVR